MIQIRTEAEVNGWNVVVKGGREGVVIENMIQIRTKGTFGLPYHRRTDKRWATQCSALRGVCLRE